MRRFRKKAVSVFSCVVLICSMLFMNGVTRSLAQESEEYIGLDTIPFNIRALLMDTELNSTNVQFNTFSTQTQNDIQIIDTDDINSIRMEDENGNGLAKVFGSPIRYTDENGDTHFIDTSLTEENWFTSLITGYHYRNTANSISIKFSKRPDKGMWVDEKFTVAIYNPDDNSLPLGYADQTIDGSGRVVYPQAFGEDTYVEYINTYTGVKENTVLEKYSGKNRFEYIFESEEYVPLLSADETTVEVVNKDNPQEEVYTFSPIYVYDAYEIPEEERVEEEAEPSKEPIRVGPANGTTGSYVNADDMYPKEYRHFTEDNYYEIEKIDDEKYKITAVVSNAFLTHPETVYPVTIDPAFGATNTNAEDSYVWQNSANSNYGSLDYMRFGRNNGGDMIGYFRFSQLPSLPSRANITNATLKFTFRSGQTTGADGICFIVTDKPWHESSLTWSNQPYGSWGYRSSHNNFQYYNFYVQPFVEMWYYGGVSNYGVDFTYENMINDYNSVVSSEGDAARAPTLTISYKFTPSISMNKAYPDVLDWGRYRWYKFVPIQTDWYNVFATGNVDTKGSIYQGSTLLASNDDSGEGNNFSMICKLNKGTIYYIKVSGYNDEVQGDYSLRIESYFIARLQMLQNLAKSYAGDLRKSVELTMQFIRRGKYNGTYSGWDKWALAAGDIDQNFVNYVKSNSPELYDYFTITDDFYYYPPSSLTGEFIDIPHLAATYNIYHYNSTGNLAGLSVAEDLVDSLGGWGGDLRSMVPFVIRDTSNLNIFSSIYDQALLCIGDEKCRFNMPDLLADVDAYNLYRSIDPNSLYNTFTKYYLYGGSGARYTKFMNGLSKAQLLEKSQNIIDTGGVLNLVWPIYEVDKNDKDTTNKIALTDLQKYAIAEAFADFIWQRSIQETESTSLVE